MLLAILLCLSQTLTSSLGNPSSEQLLTMTLLRRGLFLRHDRSLSARSNTYTSNPAPQQYSDADVVQPWSCGCEYFWKDLGDEYYPRYVRDGRCSQRSCWYGHYSCVPFVYPLNVLKRVNPVDSNSNGYRYSLGEEYSFVTVNVTVNCECRHDVVHQK